MHGLPLLAPHYLETSLSSIVQTPKRDRWAHLRFSIIGALLAAPPSPGCLMASLQALAAKPWRHPDTGLDIRFSAATLERWYYAARRGADPVAVLRDRKRDNVGQFPSLNPQLIRENTPPMTRFASLPVTPETCGQWCGDCVVTQFVTARLHLFLCLLTPPNLISFSFQRHDARLEY